ncbi:glycerate kinase [Gloeothece citriformis PCC 7424]|uniref:Glycerate kinase n=1 Tax=Gloeothece citriformis (strain PCC 7424) TaxID=65393 RepID=B7KBZ9_GLOC7|nr:glycerate kinase [Gloeothece citriformis]ACK68822.1 glycerate kinase [Gloeothece citriformis PCC 7424]
MEVFHLLKGLSQGKLLTSEELHFLTSTELAHSQRAKAFHLTPENGLDKIKQRVQLFQEIYQPVSQLCHQLGIKNDPLILSTLWELWLPLGIELGDAKQKKGSPYIVGILGGQGTGKTTLTKVIQLILHHLNYNSFGLSIDDIYKPYQERKFLKETEGLIWRGPPGTHDIESGIQVLDQVLQQPESETILIPRFDKSLWNGEGDRIEPEPITPPIDIMLFEGWFVGVRPIDDEVFQSPLSPIAVKNREFARKSNQRLKEYLPLWERLNYLMILYPVNYRLSKQWRKEAEHKMIAQGKMGMNDQEIERFVEYFWTALHPELFITPLTQKSDLVVEINSDRTLGKIYCGRDKS